jgi:pimeloyl-ACP methyl ester carboxylesterase
MRNVAANLRNHGLFIYKAGQVSEPDSYNGTEDSNPMSGCPCAPPQDSYITNAVLDKGYQMLYLDQRGTGLSTPISAATLALQGDINRQADYLKLFRADSIVKDCEAIRKTLTEDYPTELKKWSIFGQSFGGFCVLTYLSKFPQGLREAFITGGLAPIGRSADQVYQATYQKVMERNKAYYSKYPEDVDTVHSKSHAVFHLIRAIPSPLLPYQIRG